MFGLAGKTALITGGTTGLGLAVAERFIEAGSVVVVANIIDDRAIADEIGAKFVHTDVSDEASVEAALIDAERAVGPLDILVNNAGLKYISRLEDMDTGRALGDIAVNFHGVMFGLKHGPRHMRDGGSIINTASLAGLINLPGFEPYSAAKAAVISLTKTAALELGARAIRVNAVCPGNILVETVAPGAELDGDIRFTEIGSPAQRIGQTDDVVGVYHFLAADESRYVSGQAIAIDGGWSAGISQGVVDLVSGD